MTGWLVCLWQIRLFHIQYEMVRPRAMTHRADWLIWVVVLLALVCVYHPSSSHFDSLIMMPYIIYMCTFCQINLSLKLKRENYTGHFHKNNQQVGCLHSSPLVSVVVTWLAPCIYLHLLKLFFTCWDNKNDELLKEPAMITEVLLRSDSQWHLCLWETNIFNGSSLWFMIMPHTVSSHKNCENPSFTDNKTN